MKIYEQVSFCVSYLWVRQEKVSNEHLRDYYLEYLF